MALGRSGRRAVRGAAEEEEEQEAVEEHEPGAAEGGFLGPVAERFAGLWLGLGVQFQASGFGGLHEQMTAPGLLPSRGFAGFTSGYEHGHGGAGGPLYGQGLFGAALGR